MNRCLTFLILLMCTFSVSGQKPELEAEVILQSRHIWRGSKLGDAMAIEPSVTAAMGRFSFNIWASRTTNNSYSEIDLVPSWQFHEIALTLLDYYNPIPGEDNQFLNFKDEMNRHSLELTLDNYSVDKRRFKWMIGTFLLGDRNEETDRPCYSTYLELKYPFTLWGIEADPFVGGTPFRGYYAEKLAIINTGISLGKTFALSARFSIPVSLSLICNPYQDQQFVVVSSGIQFF